MKKDDKEGYLKVKAYFPYDEKMKTHINGGAGVIKYSKNPKNAVKFLEYLIMTAQKIYSEKILSIY